MTQVTDDNFKDKTRADGSYTIAVDPSVDEGDTWLFMPSYTDPVNREITHTFDPEAVELFMNEPKVDVNFADQTRHRLSGHFSGGNPETCVLSIDRSR